MKNILAFILISGFSLSLQAGEHIDKTLDVSATPDISIEDPNGRIEVHVWNKNKVKVSGQLSAQAKGYTFEKQGDNVVFEVDYEGKMGWLKKIKVKDESKLEFYVPRKSRIEVSIVNGAIDVAGVEGGAIIESINGNIAVKNLKRKISLETINGSITTNNIEGKVNIETINGSVIDSQSSGELRASSVQGSITSDSRYNNVEIEIVNGDVNLNLDKVDELNIDSVNGKVLASMLLNKKGDVSVSNVNGSVTLQFNKDVSAEFQIDAFVGGKIVNELSDDQADKQKYGPGRDLHFSKNGGSGRVNINTVSGKIKLSVR
jgi:DUF4097 and DUF4098 domain-containing protein YvlB